MGTKVVVVAGAKMTLFVARNEAFPALISVQLCRMGAAFG
jgi:hypothetical protein